MNYLQKLIRKEIKDVYTSVGEFHTIGTGEKQTVVEIVLSLEDYSLRITNKFELEPKHLNINNFKGSYIIEILENDDNIQIIATEDKRIIIDLRDEAYLSPEALVLNGPNDLCVIWN